jgi:uncharacterized protein
MRPELHAEPHGMLSITDETRNPIASAFALIREAEGTTIVAQVEQFRKAGLNLNEQWALITLQIHSALSAVGLTAAFATALGQVGISANVIAGFYHDHILVQWDRRHDAMKALQELSQGNT